MAVVAIRPQFLRVSAMIGGLGKRVDSAMTIHAARLLRKRGHQLGKRIHRFLRLRIRQRTHRTLAGELVGIDLRRCR